MRIARNWRVRQQRYRLVGEVCNKCGAHLSPPRDVCPECSQPAQTPFTFSGHGQVYSYTTLYDAPEGFETYLPFTVALVKLDEGPLVTVQLTDVDAEQVYVGMPVEMVTRKLSEEDEEGVILYGYKFRPVLKELAHTA